MKQILSSFLKKCETTKDITAIPNTKGVYLIADCPLTKENPPERTCTILEKRFSETLQSTITNIVTTNGLAKKHQYLSYYYMLECPQSVYQDFLAEI